MKRKWIRIIFSGKRPLRDLNELVLSVIFLFILVTDCSFISFLRAGGAGSIRCLVL